jgi:hypothetical protein
MGLRVCCKDSFKFALFTFRHAQKPMNLRYFNYESNNYFCIAFETVTLNYYSNHLLFLYSIVSDFTVCISETNDPLIMDKSEYNSHSCLEGKLGVLF